MLRLRSNCSVMLRAALRAGRVDRVEAGDRRELLLERQRHSGRHRLRARARQARADLDGGKSTVGRSLTGSCWYDMHAEHDDPER